LQDIIDQNDSSIVDIDRQAGRSYRWMQASPGEIIAIEGNIESSQLGVGSYALL
jgi:hypothetical protein